MTLAFVAHRCSWPALLAGLPAAATTMLRIDLPELAQSADTVVHGTVRRVESRWSGDKRRIVTDVEIEVTESLKGQPGSTVLVVQPGGQVGDIGQMVHGAGLLHRGRGGGGVPGAPRRRRAFRVHGHGPGQVPGAALPRTARRRSRCRRTPGRRCCWTPSTRQPTASRAQDADAGGAEGGHPHRAPAAGAGEAPVMIAGVDVGPVAGADLGSLRAQPRRARATRPPSASSGRCRSITWYQSTVGQPADEARGLRVRRRPHAPSRAGRRSSPSAATSPSRRAPGWTIARWATSARGDNRNLVLFRTSAVHGRGAVQ